MKKIRLNAKPKCHCEEHYLELCTSFDGERFVYHRYCYQCGKSWVSTEYLLDNCSNACDSYISNSIMKATDGSIIAVPRMTMTEGTVMFDNACGECYVYTLNKDGTLGKLIRLVRY